MAGSTLLGTSNTQNHLFNTDLDPLNEHLHPSLAPYQKQTIKTKNYPLDIHLPGIPTKEASKLSDSCFKRQKLKAPTHLQKR